MGFFPGGGLCMGRIEFVMGTLSVFICKELKYQCQINEIYSTLTPRP